MKNKIRFDGFKEFRTYDGSFDLNTGVVKMAFVPAPGHSPGHTAVHFPEEGIYFTKKARVQGPLKNFLSTWDAVMFDLHREIIMNGGLKKDFPGVKDWVFSGQKKPTGKSGGLDRRFLST